MSLSLLELSAHCLGGGGSYGSDAGSAGTGESTGAAGEVFVCFLGDLPGAVVPGAGAWKVVFSAQRAWVCSLASWIAAASLGSGMPSSSLSASSPKVALGKGDTNFQSRPKATMAAFLPVLAACETFL